MASASAPATPARVHLPSLLVALLIMVVGSVYPLLFADAQGRADHGLAMALFWAMSAGLVRGVGSAGSSVVKGVGEAVGELRAAGFSEADLAALVAQ